MKPQRSSSPCHGASHCIFDAQPGLPGADCMPAISGGDPTGRLVYNKKDSYLCPSECVSSHRCAHGWSWPSNPCVKRNGSDFRLPYWQHFLKRELVPATWTPFEGSHWGTRIKATPLSPRPMLHEQMHSLALGPHLKTCLSDAGLNVRFGCHPFRPFQPQRLGRALLEARGLCVPDVLVLPGGMLWAADAGARGVSSGTSGGVLMGSRIWWYFSCIISQGTKVWCHTGQALCFRGSDTLWEPGGAMLACL